MGKSKNKNPDEPVLFSSNEKERPQMAIDKILDKAEENVDTFNYEVAKLFCQRALDIEPNNLRAVDMMASLLLDLGEAEEAIKYFNLAIQLNPKAEFSNFLSLGQLTTGKEALEYYLKGVEIIEQEIEKSKEIIEEAITANAKPQKNLHRLLSNAFCSIAELFMTDNCDEEHAEEQCKLFVEKAITSDPSNPEAYQLLAGFYLVTEDHSKAREMMDKSLSLWLPQYQAIREGDVELTDGTEVCPLTYSCRINAVKNLLELDQFDEAEMILNGLVEEDDEVIEVWYLLGLMNDLRGEDYRGNARFYFNKCKQVAAKVGSYDEDMMNHVEEMLQKLGIAEESDDDENKENEDDDDDYEDIESSEEEMEL